MGTSSPRRDVGGRQHGGIRDKVSLHHGLQESSNPSSWLGSPPWDQPGSVLEVRPRPMRLHRGRSVGALHFGLCLGRWTRREGYSNKISGT